MAGKSLIQSLDRALEIMEIIRDAGKPLRCAALAAKMELNNSTANNILRSLCIHGYLTQDENKCYLLGPACARLAGPIAAQHAKLAECVRTPIQNLFRRNGFTSYFGCDYYGALYAVALVTVDGTLSLNEPQNWLDLMHATSTGKIIIAEKGLEWYRELCRRSPRVRCTEWTVTEPAEMQKVIDEIHYRGYVVSCNDHLPHLTGVAVPVRRRNGEFLGALSQSFSTGFLDGGKIVVEKEVEQLQDCAAEITAAYD